MTLDSFFLPKNTSFHLKGAYDMVNSCDEKDPLVASWSEDGLYFIVKDKGTFEKKYLTEIKYASFVKQLNNYGFKNITSLIQASGEGQKGEECFRHDNFRKSCKDLLRKIVRKKQKDKNEELIHFSIGNGSVEKQDQNEENERLRRENRFLREKVKHLLRQVHGPGIGELMFLRESIMIKRAYR
mmetsp:Transcript_19455/g.25715  ORF Transcript_19455/g.25715 Transcript_19455/m.25715 type:complete len:184 (-) Transcript_19455:1099-1650(-)